MKVEQLSAVEDHTVNMSVTTSSTTSTTGQKVSRFAAKTGFVIPKNKLSGSLVPIFRGGKKPGGNDNVSEDNTNQIQRKTKWGPDLTQDAVVRRGRALAYQTRVDQITRQLKSGNLDIGDTKYSALAAQNMVKRSSDTELDSEKSELLEVERQEAIGEMLKLNPSYKAPADYKPLLKEATVPIPVKEYPGCNFAGLIFGPGSDTKKRLQKETGAKVQVYGIKGNREKVEISSPDGDETQDAYHELYVHLSADTFEKVDGAVALIELLVNSISGNLGTTSVRKTSGNDVNVPSQTMDIAISCATDATLNHQIPQLTLASLQGQFQYQNSWFPTSLAQPNFSAPILNSSVPAQSSPSNLSSFIGGPQPAPEAGYNSVTQKPSFVSSSPQLPRQVLSSQPYNPQMHPLSHPGPRTFLVSNPNPPSAQPGILSSVPYTGSQPQAMGPPPGTRLSMSLFPQTASSVPSRLQEEQPDVPTGSSKSWSGTSVSLGPSNVGQLPPPVVVHSQVPHPAVARPVVPSGSATPPNMSATFATGQSGQLTIVPVNHPSMSFAPGPPTLRPTAVSVPMALPTPMQSSSSVISMVPSPIPSINTAMTSRPILSPSPSMSLSPSLPGRISGSIPGNMANFPPMNQPAAVAPRPPHGSSGDFTFQPHHTQGPASPMVPRPGSQAANLHALAPRSVVQHPAPSFQFGMHNSTPQQAMQVFPRAQSGNQMGLPHAHMSSSLHTANPNAMTASPRPPAFLGSGPLVNTNPVSQMGLRNFVPSPQTLNMDAPFPSRSGHSLPHQLPYSSLTTRPGNFMSLNPQFARGPIMQSIRPTSGHSTGQQVYDPFSPTSVPVLSELQGGGKANTRKQESDPEYEDLMASVGVK